MEKIALVTVIGLQTVKAGRPVKSCLDASPWIDKAADLKSAVGCAGSSCGPALESSLSLACVSVQV